MSKHFFLVPLELGKVQNFIVEDVASSITVLIALSPPLLDVLLCLVIVLVKHFA